MKRVIMFLMSLIIMVNASVIGVFADAPSSWAQREIATAISLDLVPDYLQSNYQAPIKRIEFMHLMNRLAQAWQLDLKSLVRAKGISLSSISYNDTKDQAVLYFSALGIVTGDGKGSFRPNARITRQESTKVLFNSAATLTSVVDSEIKRAENEKRPVLHHMPHNFDDGYAFDTWARESSLWCFRYGIMNGVSDTKFNPRGYYTREQAILTVLRLYYLEGKSGSLKITNHSVYPLLSYFDYDPVVGWFDEVGNYYSVDRYGYIEDPNIDYKFTPIFVGAGVMTGYVINRKGEKQFADLFDNFDGLFSDMKLQNNYIELWPIDVVGVDSVTMNLKTGEKYVNTHIETFVRPQAKTLPGGTTIKTMSASVYAIYSRDGKKLSRDYRDGLRYLGENIFIAQLYSSPTTVDILYCNGQNAAKIIMTIRTNTGFWNDVVYFLGNGLYGVYNTLNEFIVFDQNGKIVSKVNIANQNSMTMRAYYGLLYIYSINTQNNEIIKRCMTPFGDVFRLGSYN